MTPEEIKAVAPTARRLFALLRIAMDTKRTDEQRARAIDRFVGISGLDAINEFARARLARLYPTLKGK